MTYRKGQGPLTC